MTNGKNILNILIPSMRELERVHRLIKSLSLIEVKFCVRMIRNFDKEPFRDSGDIYDPFIELAKMENFLGVVDTGIKYNDTQELGTIYRELYESVPSGQYFIFLEDDDYLIQRIIDNDLRVDITISGYKSEPSIYDSLYWEKTRHQFMADFSLDGLRQAEEKYDCFQLSCMIAKKKELPDFEWTNDLNNDFKLFMALMELAYSREGNGSDYKKGFLFQQTTHDNISFPEFNKDSRWAQK